MTEGHIPQPTQAHRVLEVLLKSRPGAVSKSYLIQMMMLSQAGARINELENDHGWLGYIAHGPAKDEHGFKMLSVKGIPENLPCDACRAFVAQYDRKPGPAGLFDLPPSRTMPADHWRQ